MKQDLVIPTEGGRELLVVEESETCLRLIGETEKFGHRHRHPAHRKEYVIDSSDELRRLGVGD